MGGITNRLLKPGMLNWASMNIIVRIRPAIKIQDPIAGFQDPTSAASPGRRKKNNDRLYRDEL